MSQCCAANWYASSKIKKTSTAAKPPRRRSISIKPVVNEQKIIQNVNTSSGEFLSIVIIHLNDLNSIRPYQIWFLCIRLCCEDGSEFLFLAASDTEMEEWINKIQFHAQLPPSLQLMSYDESQKVCWCLHHCFKLTSDPSSTSPFPNYH